MAPNRRLQAIESLADLRGDLDEGVEQLQLPEVCGPADVARALGCSYSRVMQLQREHKLTRFLLPNPITNKRYSGRKLAAYRRGDGEGRHFFGSVRKRA